MPRSVPSSPAQDIRDHDPALAVLGYVVFWRLSGVQIRRADLARLLADAGFAHALPAPPKPARALRRALLQLRWHCGWSETLLLRTISSSPCVLALVEEEPAAPESLAYRIFLRARYGADTQQVWCTFTPTGPIDATTEAEAASEALRTLFAREQDLHTGEDLSRVLRGIVVGCQAVRLQRGVYFVPLSHSEPLNRLDRLVARLPGTPLFATLAQLDERGTRARLVHAIHADLVGELEAMEAGLLHLQATHPQPGIGALSSHLVRVRAVQQKAQVYAELLGTRAQEIQARLQTLQERVQHLVLFEVDDLLR
jgi:hypothetical protein